MGILNVIDFVDVLARLAGQGILFLVLGVVIAGLVYHILKLEKRLENKGKELQELTKEALTTLTTSNNAIDKVVNQFDQIKDEMRELRSQVKEGSCKNGR